MKYFKKHHSILFTLLAPMFSVILLLLLFAAMTISAIYIRQTEETTIHSNLEILNQTDASLRLVHNHIYQVSADIIQKPYLGDLLIEPLDTVHDEWNCRHRLGSLLSIYTCNYYFIIYSCGISDNGFDAVCKQIACIIVDDYYRYVHFVSRNVFSEKNC